MPIDYVIPAGGDQGAVLQTGADIDADFQFDVPNTATTAAAVMTLMRRVGNPNNLRWTAAINGTGLRSYPESSTDIGVIQEVFAGSLLNRGGNNTVSVRIESGEGRLEVSDFAIYFRTSV